MSYLFFKNINQEEFDEFVEKHEYCNLLQSYNWAKVKITGIIFIQGCIKIMN